MTVTDNCIVFSCPQCGAEACKRELGSYNTLHAPPQEQRIADEWCADCARETRKDFMVFRASVSKDGRFIWMVCDPHTCTYSIVCRFDMRENTLEVITDGDSAEEQLDGTILVTGKKTYLYDDKGVSLGAAWYDEWITPEGKVLRKGRPVTMSEMQAEDAAELEKMKNVG